MNGLPIEPFDYLYETSKICKKICDTDDYVDYLQQVDLSLNSLGGGNHFQEVNEDNEGNKWLLVHCGSRNFGLKTALYHQNKAKELLSKFYQEDFKNLEFLPKDMGGDEYLEDMRVAQQLPI